MIAYHNGRYLPEEEVHFSPDDRGLQFADGVYEVIHSYRGRLFRLDDHLSRLRRSLAALRIGPVSIEEIGAASAELIRRNEAAGADLLVYVQVTRGASKRAHAFPPPGVKPTVYVSLNPHTPRIEEAERGVAVVLASDPRWARCDIKSLALLPNVLALQDAYDRGAADALFVRDGMVLEATRANFAGIAGGRLVTPPESNYMLAGITRKVVLELCGRLGVPVEERVVPERELYTFDEILLMSTGSEIIPVTAVNGVRIGEPGAVTRRLQRALREVAGAP